MEISVWLGGTHLPGAHNRNMGVEGRATHTRNSHVPTPRFTSPEARRSDLGVSADTAARARCRQAARAQRLVSHSLFGQPECGRSHLDLGVRHPHARGVPVDGSETCTKRGTPSARSSRLSEDIYNPCPECSSLTIPTSTLHSASLECGPTSPPVPTTTSTPRPRRRAGSRGGRGHTPMAVVPAISRIAVRRASTRRSRRRRSGRRRCQCGSLRPRLKRCVEPGVELTPGNRVCAARRAQGRGRRLSPHQRFYVWQTEWVLPGDLRGGAVFPSGINLSVSCQHHASQSSYTHTLTQTTQCPYSSLGSAP